MEIALVLVALKFGAAVLYPPSTTTGVLNPAVTQSNIQTTICKSGWTKTVRPSVSYTNDLKAQQMKDMGLKGKPKNFEEDHFIPLELGGNPTDPQNLWPQTWSKPGAHQKDAVENFLRKQVCAGSMTLADAQKAISSDWYAIYLQRAAKKPTETKASR